MQKNMAKYSPAVLVLPGPFINLRYGRLMQNVQK